MAYLLKMVIFHGYVSHNQRLSSASTSSSALPTMSDLCCWWNFHQQPVTSTGATQQFSKLLWNRYPYTSLNPMVLLIIIPMKNGYFIGKIYTPFSDKPIFGKQHGLIHRVLWFVWSCQQNQQICGPESRVFFDEHYWNTGAKEVDCRVTEILRSYQ